MKTGPGLGEPFEVPAQFRRNSARNDHAQGHARPVPAARGRPLTLIFPGKNSASIGRTGELPKGSLSQVVRLIHLNGPPGIGKSTIASAFADRHPGGLNLDIDRVAAMIGGSGDSFSDSFEAGRLLAAAMAKVYLASGHDVIMPQMMTLVNARELADFEAAAAAAKAEYLQILLTANVEPSVERCMERAKAGIHRMPSAKSSEKEAAGTLCGCSMHRSLNFQLKGSHTQLLTASGSQPNRPVRPSKLHSGHLDPGLRPPQEAARMSTGLDRKPAIDAGPRMGHMRGAPVAAAVSNSQTAQ